MTTAARPQGVTIIAILAFIGGIAELVVGWGLWGLRPWAWAVSVIVFIVNIVLTLLTALGGNSLISIGTLVGIAIPAIILYYLMTPPVKAVFGRP